MVETPVGRKGKGCMLTSVLAQVEKQKTQLLEFIGRMISFATPNPPAKNTHALQKWLGEWLEGFGIQTVFHDLYPGEPLLVGKITGEKPLHTLILNGHVDVAQINEDEHWDSDPFVAQWDERYLYGRGAADMKGGFAAALWAVKLLRETGLPFKNNLMIQSVIGEEAGEHGTKKLLELGYLGDLAMIPEPTELKLNGQGGVVTMWITLRSPETFHDGIRARMIHAGGGIQGASAIEKMVKIIQGLQELERYWAVQKSYPGCSPGANTINPAVIQGGRNPAFVADECSLWVTIHFLPNERIEDVKNEVFQVIDSVANADPWMRKHRPLVQFGGTSMFRDQGEIFPAAQIQKENPLVQSLFRIYQECFGRPAESTVWPCVSDAGWFAEAGVPSVICGPGRLEEAHSINEKIEITQILDATRFYASVVFDLCVR